MKQPMQSPPRRGLDVTSAVMVLVTLAAVFGAAWLRDGRSKEQRPVAVGDIAPALYLVDLETSEPLVLAGTLGKVVWITFWSARARESRSSLEELEQATRPLRAQGRFALVLAAVDTDEPAGARAAVFEARVDMPVYLASAESRRRFGALDADSPLHVLIDVDGRVHAIARGADAQTIKRIAEQAKHQLDEIEPLGKSRFAAAPAGVFRATTAGRARAHLRDLKPSGSDAQGARSSSSWIRAATS
jgi:hypothetical protein